MKKMNFFGSVVFVLLSGTLMANDWTNGFQEGKIDLKSGETFEGYVAAWEACKSSNVLYKSSESENPIKVNVQNIRSVEKAGKILTPKSIQWEGRSVQAFLEKKVDGTFQLFQAHFYAPKKRGKNVTTHELQSAWVIHSPVKGWVVIGKNVKASTLNLILQHPKNTVNLEPQILGEDQLVETLKNYNEKL